MNWDNERMRRLFKDALIFTSIALLFVSVALSNEPKAPTTFDCTQFKSQTACQEVRMIMSKTEKPASAQSSDIDRLDGMEIKNSVGLCEMYPENEICKKIREKK